MWKKGIGDEVEVSGRWGRSLRTVVGVISGLIHGRVFEMAVLTSFGSPFVVFCCARRQDTRVGCCWSVCFVGFFDGHGGGGGCRWGVLVVVMLIDGKWQVPARVYEGDLVC